MRVILKAGTLVLSIENDAVREAFAAWRASKKGHVFSFDGGTAKGGALHDLGRQADACREPINIIFEQGEARWWPISNLVHTPFTMRGPAYASIEGFWQGLKFEDEADRDRVAALWGKVAKKAAHGESERELFVYDGATCTVGAAQHRALMLQACRAKFAQNRDAREALLATGDRPLTHRVRRDSATISGARPSPRRRSFGRDADPSRSGRRIARGGRAAPHPAYGLGCH